MEHDLTKGKIGRTLFLFALPYVATVNAHFYESLIEKEDVSEEQPEGDYEEITNE